MRQRRTLFALTAVAMALVLSGCSVGPQLSYADSPLAKYLGDQSPQADAEARAEGNARVGELVTACMAKTGFEYVAAGETAGTSAASTTWETDNPEWIAQYGYGVVNWPGHDASTDGVTDPNAAYVATLSEGRRADYYAALSGGGTSATDDGCFGAATREIFPGRDDAAVYAEFSDLLAAMNAISAPSEASDADRDWAGCMNERGLSFVRQTDAAASISDKRAKLPENAGTADLAALAAEEVALAQEDRECREKTNFTQKQLKVRFAAEEKFIEEHRAELDAYVKALQGTASTPAG